MKMTITYPTGKSISFTKLSQPVINQAITLMSDIPQAEVWGSKAGGVGFKIEVGDD